ncbi:MAG: hypothetical protein QM536_09655, partial [Chitinophagaceae bacterium]|nr:hypothetical protein [Chitinophagaceae bacterium]
QLKKQNKTVFITSHIVEHIQSIADFIFVIENYETTFLMNPVEFHHYISGLNTIIDNKIEKITLL